MKTSVFTYINKALILILLTTIFSTHSRALSPPNLDTDINWTDTGGVDLPYPGSDSASYNGVIDIMAAFNHARRQEEIQLGLDAKKIKDLKLPSQSVWDALSDDAKALFLLNDERTARAGMQTGVIGLPFAGVESSIDSISGNYTTLLHDTNKTFHHEPSGNPNIDGPSIRIEQHDIIGSLHKDSIVYSVNKSPEHSDGSPHYYGDSFNNHAACHEFIARAENTATFISYSTAPLDSSSIPLPIERAVYFWVYNDSQSFWGHREAILLQDETLSQVGSHWGFKNNNGSASHEGFLGLHIIGSTDYRYTPIPSWANHSYGFVVVMNIFDPVKDTDAATRGCTYTRTVRTEDLPVVGGEPTNNIVNIIPIIMLLLND